MPHPNGRAPHILVADGAAEILALMRELLEAAGYRATTVARTGQELATITALGPDPPDAGGRIFVPSRPAGRS